MFLDVVKNIAGRSDCSNVRFIIVGNGELRSELIQYAKMIKVDQFVKFTGWAEDMASVYADLDIVALTSLNEGTPVSLIEALASARPVVSTDVGGVKDIIVDGEHGLLTLKNDVRDFSDKLISLLTDAGKRGRFGRAGREFVREKYSKNRLIAEISELYEKSLNGNSII
jgi:glycosyltransferase involved in cell wall biosynthesis